MEAQNNHPESVSCDCCGLPPPQVAASGYLHSLSSQQRDALFGAFKFTPSPQADNPEHVTIDPQWVSANIGNVTIPQLAKFHITHGTSFNHKGAAQLQGLWDAWDKAGLLDHVLTFDGSWAPRYKRKRAYGGLENLSNHAWGTAFDINAQWNPLSSTPAALGTKGSTRELVALAEAHGFAWGGNFKSRPDGMHFELAKILSA